jgi:hypothetical protein
VNPLDLVGLTFKWAHFFVILTWANDPLRVLLYIILRKEDLVRWFFHYFPVRLRMYKAPVIADAYPSSVHGHLKDQEKSP